MTGDEHKELHRRVLSAFEGDGGADKDELYWRVKPDGIHWFVNCNDLFWWGTADAEDLTAENVGVLEQAVADCRAADPVVGTLDASRLFCCRVRRMRPQGAYYPKLEKILWTLFDACGPERAVDYGNPKPRPADES